MQYEVTLQVSAAISRADMDHNDRTDYPVGNYRFIVVANEPGTAESYALDALHETVPMSRPEDFDIETLEIKPVPAVAVDVLFASQL